MATSQSLPVILERAARGRRLDDAQARALVSVDATGILETAARRRRDAQFGDLLTYSPKVFIPLTELCRDVCHYCTFAKSPKRVQAPYLSEQQVLDIARRGVAAGCHEALFTLGDRPEDRYLAARAWLDERGFKSTIDYLAHTARLVFEQTGLLPHLNPGVLNAAEFEQLKPVSASMGMMLESSSERLCQHGQVHFGSPDKAPDVRIASINAAGQARVPFTSGILIGIGETLHERVDSLLALRDAHERYGHLQEVIVQNFRAKPDTKLKNAAEPTEREHRWTIAMARLILPTEVSVQAPPNLADDHDGALDALINAGINDFGGVSAVTPDHVNPEAPWPQVDKLRAAAGRCAKALAPRLAVYPDYQQQRDDWLTPTMKVAVRQRSDATGFAREDGWHAGDRLPVPKEVVSEITAPVPGTISTAVTSAIARAVDGQAMDVREIEALLMTRGAAFSAVCEAANAVREKVNGDRVSYVVTRNINYTNICSYKCRFCAFSKGSTDEDLRGKPYDLDLEQIGERVAEAWNRGATEVCLQGGIHPRYTGDTYLEIVRVVKEAAPDIHVHAFTPLEVLQGADTLGLSVRAYLERLKEAGLGSLPGTSAEILDDRIRKQICPDKLTSSQWVDVMKTAHSLHLHSTSTIMFGHVESAINQARHLVVLRDLAELTRGITELVPLPFVHMEAPMYRRGESRRGPTFRESVLIHAVGRLALNPVVTNIQASWVKLGPDGVRAMLDAGVNDLGGTLMNESITRAAGATHGEEFTPQAMQTLIERAGRQPWQRTTLYDTATDERINSANVAPALNPLRTATPAPSVQVFS